MPHVFDGATIEPREVPMWGLFAIHQLVVKELEDRARRYIVAIGYTPFKYTEPVMVQSVMRGKVQLVRIITGFEQDHQKHELDISVPIQLFEATLRPVVQAVSHA